MRVGKIGTIVNGIELITRCPHCGDSEKSSDRGHCSLNLITGLYYCVKCNSGGKADLGSLPLKYLNQINTFEPVEQEDQLDYYLSILKPGPGSSRSSTLGRFHFTTESNVLVDVFKIRDRYGKLNGLHFSTSNPRRKYVVGSHGFGYGEPNLGTLKCYRVVEGPYDCIDIYDVCLYGGLSAYHQKQLTGKRLILCPDGDIANNPFRLYTYLRRFFYRNIFFIDSLELLPDNVDPSDMPISERKSLNPKEVITLYHLLYNIYND